MNDNQKYALQYAQHGIPVYPCWGTKDGKCLCGGIAGCKPGKHPYAKAVPHGTKDATTDEVKIREWFRGALVNIALVVDGFCVLDVEKRNGGMEQLAEWERIHGKLPLTPNARTGGDGEHFYFLPHPEISLNKPQIKFVESGGAELLVGGGVMAPPSNHISGGKYDWTVRMETPMAHMPDWLVEQVVNHQKAAKTGCDEPFDPMRGTVSTGTTFAELGKLPAGRRNEPVNFTIGSMLGSNYTREQILEEGIKWAESQEPPYSIKDLEEKVDWVIGKEVIKVQVEELESGEPEDNEPKTIRLSALSSQVRSSQAAFKPDNNTTPVEPCSALPEAAYYGLLGEYLRVVEPLTEADPAGILACLLAGIGNTLGKRLHHLIGKRHSGNLFVLLVGSTSSRKGTCWAVAESLLSVACPNWHTACLEHGFGSGQGFVDRIRDAQGDDAGIPDKRLLVVEEEWIKPLKLCRQESSILSPLIRSAFDGAPLSVMNRKENRYGCREPHVSIIGMIPPDELKEQVKGRTELVNGTINRFLLVECRKWRFLPFGGDYLSVGGQFAGRLKDALKSATAITDKPLSIGTDACELWEGEYRRLEQEHPGDYGKAVARLSVHCLKVAMLYAALDGSPVIGLPHLKAALSFINYCDCSAFVVFGKGNDRLPEEQRNEEPLDEEPPHARLLNLIKSRPEGITKTDAHKLFGNHLKSGELDKLFHLLKDFIVEVEGRWYSVDCLTGVCGSTDSNEPDIFVKESCESANLRTEDSKDCLTDVTENQNNDLHDGIRKLANSQFAPTEPPCSPFADSQFARRNMPRRTARR
jgi:hypothetical protein